MTRGEKILVARQSAFQAIRLTEDAGGLRTLYFEGGDAAQSCVNPHDARQLVLPYTRLLPACFAFAPQARRVLIVGLGGGAVPRFLHHCFPAMTIDVVELDAEVLAIAKEFCGLREDERLRVWVDDGRDFIQASEGGYDALILDSFDAESVPAHLATREFLQAVRKTLAPGGIAIANVWGRARNPLYASMLQTYEAAFASVYVFDVPVPGTKLFVALPQQREMLREQLLGTVQALTEAHDFGYNLAGEVAGFRPAAEERAQGGAVLRD